MEVAYKNPSEFQIERWPATETHDFRSEDIPVNRIKSRSNPKREKKNRLRRLLNYIDRL
jgi:hypothetical protein